MTRCTVEPPDLEKSIGILVYLTCSPPIRAKLRERFEDFIVEEILHPEVVLGERGRYAIFVLEKRGVDTFEAVRIAARLLRVDWRTVGYAGMKDRNALTRQYISVPAGLLDGPPASLSSGRVSLRLVGYSDKPVKRGLLAGNQFKIVLRHRSEEPEKVRGALYALGELGVIPGFYGHQRFGTRRPNTHIVGHYLVRREWDKAVAEIAGHPYPFESPEAQEARRAFDEGRLEEALAMYPRALKYERILTRRLLGGASPLEALRSLPRSLLELYVSAYQSYLFNMALSRRILEVERDLKRPVDGEVLLPIRPGCCPHGIPVPGAGLDSFLPRKTSIGEIVWSLLEEEGVSPADFRIPELKVGGKAHLRPVCCVLEGYRFRVGDEESRISFKLAPGMYASVALREVVKGDPLEANY